RKPPQLAGERCREPEAATELARSPERLDAAVGRQRLADDRVGQDDDLVHARRERPHLRHRRGERRVLRVDLLRDEDELRYAAGHQSESIPTSPLSPAPNTSSSMPSGPASNPPAVCGPPP